MGQMDATWTERFNTVIAASGWTPADGPFPGVFDARPAGHRCLWSCCWMTESATLRPSAWAPASDPDIMRYELADLAARGDRGAKDALDHNRGTAQYLEYVRRDYQTYPAPWSGKHPALRVFVGRPGWPVPRWAERPTPVLTDIGKVTWTIVDHEPQYPK
ncbi:MAG: hypothetical protein ACKOC5_08670 [Chloroflexota bacterium]